MPKRFRISIEQEKFLFPKPFLISGYAFQDISAVVLDDGVRRGRATTAGVYFLDETAESIAREIEECRPAIEAGLSREELALLSPPGGAPVRVALVEARSNIAQGRQAS